MIGTVWGLTFNKAAEQLQKIMNDYEYYHKAKPVSIKNSHHAIVVHYDNGDWWRAIEANEHWRALRCNVAYIDHEIDNDIINTVIKPTTICPPYQAINYY